MSTYLYHGLGWLAGMVTVTVLAMWVTARIGGECGATTTRRDQLAGYAAGGMVMAVAFAWINLPQSEVTPFASYILFGGGMALLLAGPCLAAALRTRAETRHAEKTRV